MSMAEFIAMTKKRNGGKPVEAYKVPDPYKVPAPKPAEKVIIRGGVNMRIMAACIAQHGLPAPVLEHKFHMERRWRFDLAWVTQKVALEIQGGLFAGKPCQVCGRRSGGRHNHPEAMRNEYEKLNAAATLGWRVLFILPEEALKISTMQLIGAAITNRPQNSTE